MKFTLRKKLILVNLFLLVIVTASASFITMISLQAYYKSRIYDQLKVHIDEIKYLLSQPYLASFSPSQRYRYLTEFANSSRLRLTLIDSSGVVLFDSRVPMDSLRYVENHLHRPEVQMALKKGIGHHQRVSATIRAPLLYVAALNQTRFSGSGLLWRIRFIRVARSLNEVKTALAEIREKILWGSAVAVLLIALVGLWISKKITDPIQRLIQVAERVKHGQLDARFQQESNDEIGELADLLNQMLGKLQDDLVEMRKLQTMRSQFLGNVSHELRTPIFALQGYLETLLEQPITDPEKRKQFLQKAYQVSVRLNNLL
ncbi:MAG: HAMP domain-containing protein, partial [Calditrichaeota bacterium]